MLARIIVWIDRLNRTLGHATAWLVPAMVLLQFAVVVLRHVFSIGFVPMQEAVWHLHGLLFMLGAGYTFLRDGHVRVDVIYRKAGPTYRAWVDLSGCVLFAIPVCLLTLHVSRDYVLRAVYDFAGGVWILEGSPEFGGLPLIWAYKTVIWVFAVTVLLQAVSVAAKALVHLRGATRDHSSLSAADGKNP